MERILIAGINSFTGRYLSKNLMEKGYEVHGTGRNEKKLDRYYALDILNIEKLEEIIRKVKPTIVINLAGITSISHSDKDEMYITNILGTRNLLEATKKEAKNIRLVILASSANVYGKNATFKTDETVEAKPVNDYGASKLSMEIMAEIYSNMMPITIVRPFNYTGVGQDEHFIIPKIVNHFKRGAKEIELGNIDVYREYNDVRDICSDYIKIIEKKPAGKVLNVGGGGIYTIKQILNFMERITEKEIEIKINQKLIRENEIKKLSANVDLLDELTYSAERINFENTLEWMYRWAE